MAHALVFLGKEFEHRREEEGDHDDRQESPAEQRGFDVNESLAARRFMALVTLHVSQRFDGVPGRR